MSLPQLPGQFAVGGIQTTTQQHQTNIYQQQQQQQATQQVLQQFQQQQQQQLSQQQLAAAQHYSPPLTSAPLGMPNNYTMHAAPSSDLLILQMQQQQHHQQQQAQAQAQVAAQQQHQQQPGNFHSGIYTSGGGWNNDNSPGTPVLSLPASPISYVSTPTDPNHPGVGNTGSSMGGGSVGTVASMSNEQLVAMYAQALQQQQSNPYFQQQFLQAQAQAQLQLQAQMAQMALIQQQVTAASNSASNTPPQMPFIPQAYMFQPQPQTTQEGHMNKVLSPPYSPQLNTPSPGLTPPPHPSQRFRSHSHSNPASPMNNGVVANGYPSRQTTGGGLPGGGIPISPASGYSVQHLTPTTVAQHPTPLAVQPFLGGVGSVLLVENLDPIPLTPGAKDSPLVQLNTDHLFTIFGVYGDVVRVKIFPSGERSVVTSPVQGSHQPKDSFDGSSASQMTGVSNIHSFERLSICSNGSASSVNGGVRSGNTTPLPNITIDSNSCESASTSLAPSTTTSPRWPVSVSPSHTSSTMSSSSVLVSTPALGATSVQVSPVAPNKTLQLNTNAPVTRSTSSALIQFMSKDQASLAAQHLDGIRILGPNSLPIRIRVSTVAHIPVTPMSPSTSNSVNGSPTLSPPASPSITTLTLTKDYSRHAGHRFKYISSNNSRHICAPCASLHLSGLAQDVTDDNLRDYFAQVFQRTLGSTDPSLVTTIQSFGDVKRMAFVSFASVEVAILGLVFGHNVKLKGKYMRMSFSHAKEHQTQPPKFGTGLTAPSPTSQIRLLGGSPTQMGQHQQQQQDLLNFQQQLVNLGFVAPIPVGGHASGIVMNHIPQPQVFQGPPPLTSDVMGFTSQPPPEMKQAASNVLPGNSPSPPTDSSIGSSRSPSPNE